VNYLPAGCALPDPSELDDFWRSGGAIRPDAIAAGDYSVRWIGLDDETTTQVLELIRCGDKTGTFTLPWIVENTDQPTPAIGETIILIDFDGHPQLIVRLTEITRVPFGQISAVHTAIDGSPVRDLAVWKPMHTHYWNNMLKPFDLSVSDEMPVWVEKIELLFDAAAPAHGGDER
jgi:uncharacterized protein YhfF